jgi:hypothetical protein
MKPYRILLLISCLFVAACQQQTTTLNITDVAVDNFQEYDEIAKEWLGKQLKVEVFDNSIKVTPQGEPTAIFKLYPSGDYIGSEGTIKISKDFKGISQLEIESLKMRKSPPFSVKITLTAKRN